MRLGDQPVMSVSLTRIRPALGSSWPPIWLIRLV
jgi:hypothetical protein